MCKPPLNSTKKKITTRNSVGLFNMRLFCLTNLQDMSACASFKVQVASIMEVLAKTAVAEITKLVDDESAALRLEMCRSQRENETLKTKLLLTEGELRAVRGYGEGTPGISLNLSFEVEVCDEFREAQRRELHTVLVSINVVAVFMKSMFLSSVVTWLFHSIMLYLGHLYQQSYSH